VAVASAILYAEQSKQLQFTCSLQTDIQASTSSLNFYRTDALPDAQPTCPTNSVKALKASPSSLSSSTKLKENNVHIRGLDRKVAD